MADRLKQRTEDDTRRLAALNGWRKLKGLPAAATLEVALKASKPDSADADPDSNGLTPDVLLDESAAIAADMGAQGLFRNPGGSVVADASAAQPKP
jgi:hypothetical protein